MDTIHPSQKKIAVARVNGTVISEYHVASALQSLLEPYKDTKGKVRLPQQELYAARRHVIDNLIMRELLYQEGCRRGITATDEEIAELTRTSMDEFDSEQQFKAMLLMTGQTPEEFSRHIQRDIIINKTAAAAVEGRKQPVTSQEARQYYDAHPDEMQGPEVRRVLQVMVAMDRDADPAEEKTARRELEKIAADPAAFDRIVAEGARPGTGVRGGDLGFIARGQFHPLLDSVAFRMQQGETSRVVRSEQGLHVLKVPVILEAGKQRPFDLIEEELKAKLLEIRSLGILREFTDALRDKADIAIHDTMADSKLEQEQQ